MHLTWMLHRGKCRLPGEEPVAASPVRRSWRDRVLNMDHNFTRGDRALTVGTFIYTMSFKILALGILVWTFAVGHLSAGWWFHYNVITGVWLSVVLAAVVTVWSTIGVARDLRDLFRTLATVKAMPTMASFAAIATRAKTSPKRSSSWSPKSDAW